MGYLVQGWKPGVGPVLKVMKYDADDYLTVANDAFNRFYFNSENDKISYIRDPKALYAVNSSNYPTNNQRVWDFEGSVSDCKYSLISGSWGNSGAWAVIHFLDRYESEFVPIFEARIRYRATGRILGAVYYTRSRQQISSQFKSSMSRATKQGPVTSYLWGASTFNYCPDRYNYTGWMGHIGGNDFPQGGISIGSNGDYDIFTALWDLPANNYPIPTPSKEPISGQEVIRISNQMAVIARRGYTVEGSSGRERILDSTRNPPLCILSGETPTIPAGGSHFVPGPPGVKMTDSMICDFVVSLNDEPYTMPMCSRSLFSVDEDYQLTYAITEGGITFYNEGRNNRIKLIYLVFGTDLSQPTTGGNFARRTIGNNIQLKKSGSSDTDPSLNDILLDTRFPSLQVLAEGYIPIADFNENPDDSYYGLKAKTINFNGTGMFVFPKVCTVFPDYIRNPYYCLVKRSYTGDWRVSNQSTISRLQANSLKIHTAKGNPTEWGSSNWDYSMPDPLGVRYYILGVTPKA